MTETRLRHLESLVKAAAKRGNDTFELAGSMTPKLTDEELEEELARIKREDRELSATKTSRF